MTSKIVIALAGLMVTSGAMAQLAITPGGTNSGNGFYRYTPTTAIAPAGLNNIGNGGTLGTQQFTATNVGVNNQIWAQGWFFRVDGQTAARELAFNTGGLSAGGVTMTSAPIGGTVNDGTSSTGGFNFSVTSPGPAGTTGAQRTWTSSQTYSITAGPNGPTVITRNVITNTSTFAPLTINLFWVQDVDVQPQFGDDRIEYRSGIAPSGGAGFRMVNVAGGTEILSWGDGNVSNWQGYTGGPAPDAISDMLNGIQNNFLNTPPLDTGLFPIVGASDVNYGFQWANITLQPGQSYTAEAGFQIIPTPGAAAVLGLGGLIAGRRRRA